MATTATALRGTTPGLGRSGTRTSAAYFWLLLFIFVYFVRPEDWIPGLGLIPIEKITGFLAIAGFGLSLLAAGGQVRRMPRETLYMVLLFVQFCLAIPFAIWRGGAFQVVFYIVGKVILIAVAIALAVNTLPQLRRLLFVQACAVPVLALAALARHRTEQDGRLMGVGNGFDNSNDFAFLLALTFPFCFAFMLSTRKPLAKAAWALGMAIMGVALILTASRQGLITVAVAMGICLWEFGVKGRRLHLLFLGVVLAVGVVAVAGPKRLIQRFASTFHPEDTSTYLSTQLREQTLKDSLATAVKHPLFGVGPGNFTVVSGVWRAAHNSFTELAAEAGFPALILFLMMLYRAFGNVRKVKLLSEGQAEAMLLAGALGASLVTFVVGGLFASWEYQYLPYLLIAYSTVFYRIASEGTSTEPESVYVPGWARAYKEGHGEQTRSKAAWSPY